MALPKNALHRLWYTRSAGALASVSSVLLSIYQSTLEFVAEGDDHLRLLESRGSPYICAVWHTFADAAIFCMHHRGICIYSDHPRTREYERSWTHYFREVGLKVIRNFGYDVVDASLGKQSQGVIQFIKTIREGSPALVAPDGPHGPIYEAKPGVVYMARKAGAVVLPVGFGFSRRITGPNWDDVALPLPFSRVAVVFGAPIVPEEDAGEQALARQAAKLEAELDRLSFRANELVLG